MRWGASWRSELRQLGAPRLALVGAGIGILGAAIFCIDLATRPPCQEGYVRLLDFEPVLAGICFVLGVLCLLVFQRARRGLNVKVLLIVSIALLIIVTPLAASGIAELNDHHGARYDDCWTF